MALCEKFIQSFKNPLLKGVALGKIRFYEVNIGCIIYFSCHLVMYCNKKSPTKEAQLFFFH